MLIAHASDLHGDFEHLLAAPTPDIWVFTGDMFGAEYADEQYEDFRINSQVILDGIRGKPCLVVNGNHDRICWGDRLRAFGVNAQNISETATNYFGLTWAGFREVPPINGMFVGEEAPANLELRYKRVLSQNFDILCTHAPSHGIFSERSWGIKGMADEILKKGVPLKAHLFGHHHLTGGQTVKIRDTLFSNAARAVNTFSL